MGEEKKLAKWKVITGYSLFSLWAFFLFLYLTFPYDAMKDRLVAEAASAGYVLTMTDIGPGLFGITARNLRLSRPAEPGVEVAPAELPIDVVAFRPGLFPPGIVFQGDLFGGSVSGTYGDIGMGDVSLDVEADGVKLSDPQLKAFSGMDLDGEANLELSLDIPRVPGPGAAKKKMPDLGQADGSFKLDLSQAKLNGGTVTLTLPAFGNQPTPIDLPKISFGDLAAHVKFEKGQGTVESLKTKSEDLELLGTGTLKLAKNFMYSEPTLDLKLKTEDDFRKRLGLMGSAFSMLPADPQNPAFRVAKIGGYLSQPKLRNR